MADTTIYSYIKLNSNPFSNDYEYRIIDNSGSQPSISYITIDNNALTMSATMTADIGKTDLDLVLMNKNDKNDYVILQKGVNTYTYTTTCKLKAIQNDDISYTYYLNKHIDNPMTIHVGYIKNPNDIDNHNYVNLNTFSALKYKINNASEQTSNSNSFTLDFPYNENFATIKMYQAYCYVNLTSYNIKTDGKSIEQYAYIWSGNSNADILRNNDAVDYNKADLTSNKLKLNGENASNSYLINSCGILDKGTSNERVAYTYTEILKYCPIYNTNVHDNIEKLSYQNNNNDTDVALLLGCWENNFYLSYIDKNGNTSYILNDDKEVVTIQARDTASDGDHNSVKFSETTYNMVFNNAFDKYFFAKRSTFNTNQVRLNRNYILYNGWKAYNTLAPKYPDTLHFNDIGYARNSLSNKFGEELTWTSVPINVPYSIFSETVNIKFRVKCEIPEWSEYDTEVSVNQDSLKSLINTNFFELLQPQKATFNLYSSVPTSMINISYSPNDNYYYNKWIHWFLLGEGKTFDWKQESNNIQNFKEYKSKVNFVAPEGSWWNGHISNVVNIYNSGGGSTGSKTFGIEFHHCNVFYSLDNDNQEKYIGTITGLTTVGFHQIEEYYYSESLHSETHDYDLGNSLTIDAFIQQQFGQASITDIIYEVWVITDNNPK